MQNDSEEDWHQVTVEITSIPEFTLPWKQSIENLRKEESHSFKEPPLKVATQYLVDLSEQVSGDLIVKVLVNGEYLYEESHKIDLLTYDQWSGVGLLPEMLAAYVTPNHPEIPNIIRKASSILEKWTGSPSFDEYQSRNPNRVRKQMAAIFEAIAEMQLIYCSVPASFEEQGQRVRLADSIFTNKLANCLDLSLLYATCLEAVGIHPIVVMIHGHAFAGAWLIDESFADMINDDPSLITKRTADGINEMVVVEATCMNAGQNVSFDEAVQSADQKMMHPEKFVLFLDVKRARFSGIRPIPLRLATSNGWEIQEEEKKSRDKDSPEDIVVGKKPIEATKIEITKQRLWERKLLDLTLRNNLLNTRITKNVIQFITLNIGQLEDALANGEEFQVLSKPTDWDNALRDIGLYKSIHQTDPIADLVKHEMAHRRLRTYLQETELQSSLTNVYRSSRLALEENGANTLYIGLGMLKWYETDASEKARFAPILLLPVEIIRKSAQRGYVIRSREEETVLNITLLEMLRQDFGITIGGMDPLPRDESGVDVKAILNLIRRAVMVKNRWDVEEQAILGTFSFSKFILWNDIHHNAAQLRKNKVVASLMSGKLEWAETADILHPEIKDDQLHPAQLALPISTDSSQLNAIISSGQERSFVLHGPPGTGKSQTITNIIANALYSGKRVLFVAAKKAALDVVESRLESIGIGPFCLELHSNKSKKSDVLAQLKAATQIALRAAPENFAIEADRLFELRKELNHYVEALHKRYPFGYSLYDLFSAYSQLPKGKEIIRFSIDEIEQTTPLQLTQWQDLVDEVQAIGKIIGNPADHPLQPIKLQSYTPQLKQDANQLIEDYLKVLTQVADQTSIVKEILKLNDLGSNQTQEDLLERVTIQLSVLPDVPASLLEIDPLEKSLLSIVETSAHGKLRDKLRSELLNSYHKDILNFPADQIQTEWKIAERSWFLPKWLKQNAIQKRLKLLSLTGQISKSHIPGTLQQISRFQQEQDQIDKSTTLPTQLGFLWNNGDVNWATVSDSCDILIKINRLISGASGLSGAKDWRNRMALEWSEGSKVYLSIHSESIKEYLVLRHQQITLEKKLNELFAIDIATLHGSSADRVGSLKRMAAQWHRHIDQMKDWYNWTEVKERSKDAGLQTLIGAFENGEIRSDEVVVQFQKGFYHSAAEYILHKTPQLATFNGALFEEKIKKFRDISKQYEKLTRQELYARLAAKVPNFTQEASQSSEIGILQRAIRNNGRAMSIRKLFDLVPNLLPRLTPCMLMSPISVAQYFDADSVKFDLVIFDEASQMPTCEAVGAIARGSNVIVVGDPKQMPPTNFFSSNNVDEDNIEKEDLESILDDCLALMMPSQHLLWHYRSKHESLIAFSNAKYYESKLLTFPSQDDIASKVQFVAINGYYDKGKTRQNFAEAKAIVDEVVSRYSDPVLSKRSIGIVTFSSVQQNLIEDLLSETFAIRPDLEKTALESKEPLFIKNLENVQGDERDVILFSIGYGPDKNGKVSLNFGPINREGGWRRLNVAVSRARYEMKVFSTLRHDQIDLNRTSSEGVAGLKAFLAYAEKGKEALPLQKNALHHSEASLEHVIASEIKKYGYEVHTHIGSSSFRIDIGVVDPKNPSQYLLAILTDGKNYHNATTSNDREIVQPDVLGLLGWNVHKVWSTEWWENPDRVIEDILNAIKTAEENPTVNIGLPIDPKEPENEFINSSPDLWNNEQTSLSHNTIDFKPEPEIKSSAVNYEEAALDPVTIFSSEEFLMAHNFDTIATQIRQVLETEAPISKNLLCKRVLTAWGISRLGTRLSGHFEYIFSQMGITARVYDRNSFFWKVDQDPDKYGIFRTAQFDSQKRDADDLPPEEVANGVSEILSNQISLSKADLIREVARLFGYARIGANVESAMLLGIDKSIERGVAYEEGDRIILAK